VRLHHLNCGTLRPFGGRRVNGARQPFLTARMVCHCLLIETGQRLVLVDTGYGLIDIARLRRPWAAVRPRPRLDPTDTAGRQLPRHAYSLFATRLRLDPEGTAVRQVARLGYSPDDVSDIVLTHLDLDHAGGLPDFPSARVHVDQTEYDFAMSAPKLAARSMQRFRYWPYQWAHGPNWVTYGPGSAESWFGFQGVRKLEDLPEIALVPLPGHSPGHSGVAVRLDEPSAETGAGWLLHAADAYFDHREVDPVAPRSTPGLASMQKWFQFDRSARRETRAQLRELASAHGSEVEMFCTHDPVDFERYVPAENRRRDSRREKLPRR
jgi:glyoxylase-like metal-dependent hydrolase (beta-lactamase superfamily II)